MNEINVKVCESTNCCYLKTCQKYKKAKEKQNEIKESKITLKNMKTGEQQKVSIDEAISIIK